MSKLFSAHPSFLTLALQFLWQKIAKAVVLTESCGLKIRVLGRLFLACVIFDSDLEAGEPSRSVVGPFFSQFRLTLSAGERTEIAGPLFYSERVEDTRRVAMPPIWSRTDDDEVDFTEFDFLYPLLTWDRFGKEYRFQILQLFSFAGGQSQAETNKHRFSLFPFYFQQRSDNPNDNYTALLPLYGKLKNRFFRDEIRFVMFPIYGQSRKRDVVTDNYLFPIFHLRKGDGLEGWQVWPLVGRESKSLTLKTNTWGDVERIAGHKKLFAAWPFFFNQTTGLGTTNREHHQAFLPLYSFMRSPLRDSTTAPWPLGITFTDDRAKKYREWGAPWPFVVYARGEGKTTTRFWPLFSQAQTPILESDFYLWPVYKSNRARSAPLDRKRTRILFFLYSDTKELNTETGDALRRRDFWPLYHHRRDFNGNERLQVLALLEPILPNNKSIERNYSPLWSIWRSEKNGKTGAHSQSLFWNFYRRETFQDQAKTSALFGLVQCRSKGPDRQWRVFYLGGKDMDEITAQP